MIYSDNGIRWVIRHSRPGRITTLLGDKFRLINNPQSSLHGRQSGDVVVKSNAVRSVTSVTIDGEGQFYLKHYRPKGWRDLVKFTIFGSKAKREWNNGNLILERGVAAGKPVAYGEKMARWVVSDNYLLVESIPESWPLECLLSGKGSSHTLDFTERRKLLKGLSLFVATLHLKGILHKDLHTGNIMAASSVVGAASSGVADSAVSHITDGASSGFAIIDLYDVICMERLSLMAARRNLAYHLYSLTPYCSRSEILFVLKEYLKVYDGGRAAARGVVKDINGQMLNFRHTHMLSRSKRCMKNSSEFVVKSWKAGNCSGGSRFVACLRRLRCSGNMLKSVLERHDGIRGVQGGRIIKETSRVLITAFPVCDSDTGVAPDEYQGMVCVKEYRNLNIQRKVREALFASRGKKAWRAANGLVVRNVATPLPIAFADRRRYGVVESSFVVSAFIEPAMLVYLYVARCLCTSHGIAGRRNETIIRKRRFIDAFSTSLRRVHKEGIYHGDLKGGNVLVEETGDDGWVFYYLDLDRVVFKRSVSMRSVIKNLVQLNASLPNEFSFSDRMRFYKGYAGKKRLDRSDRVLIREVIIKSIGKGHFWNP